MLTGKETLSLQGYDDAGNPIAIPPMTLDELADYLKASLSKPVKVQKAAVVDAPPVPPAKPVGAPSK